MNAKKMSRKLIMVLVSTVLVLAAMVLTGTVYLKLIGLKSALEELVTIETNNLYSLRIGKAKVNLSALSFTFHDVHITRNPEQAETGIQAVHIAHVQLQVANLPAMFRSKKYDIRTLVIDQPLIEIDKQSALRDTAQAKFHLGQQMLKLYPPIEEVLSRFTIEHLKINGANIAVAHPPKPTIALNLVDFLIAGWQENTLGPESQVTLTMGKQHLNLEQADFQFSGVAFNLREHVLHITDIYFATADSITGSHVRIAADALQLHRLGYQDLFEKQRLTYSKVTVRNPNIDLRLRYNEAGSQQAKPVNEQEVVTRIIKQSIGECIVDTVHIENAAFKTVLYKGADSTFLEVPQFNFTLYSFEVLNSSETFYAGTADIELNKTSIALNAGIQIRCQNLRFDQARNLIFTDVALYDGVNRMEVLTCRSLALVDFHLLPLLFNRELRVETVTLTDAVLNAPANNIFGTTAQGEKTGLSKINIKHIRLENVAMQRQTPQELITAQGIWLNVNGLSKEPQKDVVYAFQNLRLRDFKLVNASAETTVHITRFNTNGNTVHAGTVQLVKGDFSAALQQVYARHPHQLRTLEHLNVSHWDTLNAASVILNGVVPTRGADPQKAVQPQELTIGNLVVQKLESRLVYGNSTASLRGANVCINALKVANNALAYNRITGTLRNVAFQDSSINLALNAIQLDLPKQAVLQGGNFWHKQTQFGFARIQLKQLTHQDEKWQIEAAQIKKIRIANADKFHFKADSLLVTKALGGKTRKPHIKNLACFGAELTQKTNDSAAASTRNAWPNFDVLDRVEQITIYPGIINQLHKPPLAFGTVNIQTKTRKAQCDYIYTELPKFNLHLKGIQVQPTSAHVDTVALEPNPKYTGYQTVEQSMITAKIYNTTLAGFNVNDFLRQGQIHGLTAHVGDFYVKSFRDKRLPDAPYEEKPATLSGLLSWPANVSLSQVTVKNGTLAVVVISDATGKRGTLDVTNIQSTIDFGPANNSFAAVNMHANGKLYGDGLIELTYSTINQNEFRLQANVQNFDLEHLNEMVLPLQAVEVKSGQLVNYNVDVLANPNEAHGSATITYKKLHLIIYKKEEPEKKNIGSTLVTLFADGFVVRNSKKNASAPVVLQRVKEKTTFHYWVSAATQGALLAIKQGKRTRGKRTVTQ